MVLDQEHQEQAMVEEVLMTRCWDPSRALMRLKKSESD